ncbi:hypothetical protein [Alicyclobacillus sp. ALC3]|uniref:hypothetical protein n=1 Tax=Alicyclobacillus sp. ALC3 TaxID=2796143 RepID=UPI0023796FF5|nr:hypothetical protein [Alicyclobacillus sp. ALC3]WDL99778.1 hypothetical protein JC200_23690 [Alicyclobacillus sp. ALC3]
MHHDLLDVMLWIVSIVVAGLFSIRIIAAIYMLKATMKTVKRVAKVLNQTSHEESTKG